MDSHEDVQDEGADVYMRLVPPETRKLRLHIVLLPRFEHLWRCRHLKLPRWATYSGPAACHVWLEPLPPPGAVFPQQKDGQ